LISSNYKNFYFNKEKSEWSEDKYGKIFNKISKGKFIKTFDYYYPTNLETTDVSYLGFFELEIGLKKVVKIFVNVRFFKHTNGAYVFSVYYYRKNDLEYLYFDFKEKDGKKQYDGTSIFTIDALKYDVGYYIQAIGWFDEEYMIINNLTVQYEEDYLFFDYLSYKSEILNEINNN